MEPYNDPKYIYFSNIVILNEHNINRMVKIIKNNNTNLLKENNKSIENIILIITKIKKNDIETKNDLL